MITYLFGAGASYNALPLANQMPSDIANLIEKLLTQGYASSDEENQGYRIADVFKEYVANTRSMLDEIRRSEYQTIDDYAYDKAQSGSDINYIRAIISIYLMIKQIVEPSTYEFRYRRFLQKLLTKEEYNKDIRLNLLTWNYDSQIELSYKKIHSYSWMRDIHEKLNIFPLINQFGQEIDNYSIKDLNVFYLNGFSGLHQSNFSGKLEYISIKDYLIPGDLKSVFSNLMYFYARYKEKILLSPIIRFGWEEEEFNRKMFNHILEAVKDTRKLIFIGYSYPDTNRRIDRLLIDNMNKLERIIIQEPSLDSYKLTEFKLKEFFPDLRIVNLNQVNDFYIPDELLI
ncbi:hypothetical protein [Leptospira licerasiae]|uniref:SIR2-like domain-containing protein n=1 Tax=Leptospira licerasiae str. MMD4847 TaxID=1049971 RepID=A0ABN0HDU9_9LEPT|nr:hypothetical protein [Leptospira licerasiae]EIE01281.1 hypothetical protein LEP1GSC185_3860 [Leptospira licerasiae serovar Varillal str. VAR 010]EJZ43765.1 hypothetical protein LEP1GSC178_2031 [Leptospira licerasiae str. MMD4847]